MSIPDTAIATDFVFMGRRMTNGGKWATLIANWLTNS